MRVDLSMVVRACIRRPVFSSPIHALCCFSFYWYIPRSCVAFTDRCCSIIYASHLFIVHASHSFTIHAPHSSLIHASHSFIDHALHSFIVHALHSFPTYASHSFSIHVSAMQLGVSLIFSSPWHASSLRPFSQSTPLRLGRIYEQMYI